MKRDRVTFVATMVDRFGRERWNEHVKLLATAFNGVSIRRDARLRTRGPFNPPACTRTPAQTAPSR
jgi:hypothetical protein